MKAIAYQQWLFLSKKYSRMNKMLNPLELTLFLNRLPRVGMSAYWALVKQFGTIENALSEPAIALKPLFNDGAFNLLTQFLSSPTCSPLYKRVLEDLRWCEEHHIHVIHEASPQYPPLLRETSRAPNVLYVRGDVDVLTLPQIAMVGSRNPSPAGRQAAEDFARHLSTNGFVVTSGLAIGVDTYAHQGVVEVQSKTIAVMGCGIDQIYPRRNAKLADSILACGGAIVSEFPVGTSPQSQNFPQRNRVISGLSYGTLVVEAAIKSGSLITARFALQQNREVFAIPGSIHSPLSRGCHTLIKSGATLVETGQDIVDELHGFLQREHEFMQPSLDLFADKSVATSSATPSMAHSIQHETDNPILAHIGFDVTEVDTIADRTALPINDLLVELMKLELAGFIDNCGAGYMRVK